MNIGLIEKLKFSYFKIKKGIMKKKLKGNLLEFFKKADAIANSETQANRFVLIYSKKGNDWVSSFKPISDWRKKRIDKVLKAKITSIPEIENCLDNLDLILNPGKLINFDKNKKEIKISGDKLQESNRKWNKSELVYLFLDFKENEYLNLSLEEFINSKSEEIFADKIIIDFKALLIGFQTKDINEFKIGDVNIRELKEEEKLQMMNNYQKGIGIDDPINIAIGYEDTMPDKYWINGSYETRIEHKKESLFHTKPRKAIEEIENKIDIILKSFRTYKSIEVGIRDFYIRVSFSCSSRVINKWTKERYKFGDFGRFEKTSPSSYAKKYHQNFNYKVENVDIVGLNETYSTLMEYYKTPLEQISQAIFYFSNSFEQIRGYYIFSDLMTSLESVLNNPDKINELDKEKTLKQLENVKAEIEKTDDVKKISKLLFKIQSYKGIPYALNIGKKIYSSKLEEQKSFYNFFLPDDKNNGCYRLRNDLFHGNYCDEIEKRIIDVLPTLSKYVQILMKKIIKLRTDGKLDCYEEKYFEKLKEIANKQ